MTEFLLTREPWLPVATPHGPTRLGLIEAFETADELMIAPGGPLEERVLHRLLLAISYTALGAPASGEYPRPLDGPRVAAWLRDHEASFDLISPTAPFGQDAALADDPAHAHIVSMANVDSTVARSRPLLTDHRRVEDIPPVPLADALISALVYNAFDAPGIHEGVKAPGSVTQNRPNGSNFSMKGTEGSTLAFVPKGTLADSLAWSMIPVDTLGTPHWTYQGPGAVEDTPDGELDALTWLFRRLLLHHDGTHATGIQVHQGRIKKTPAQKAPTDTLPGQRNYVVSASDPKTTAATGEIGAPTTAGRGNPLSLIQRWEAGSDTSLSGHIRAALTADPTLTPPRITAIGQRLENTALKVLVREAEVPRVEGGHTTTAEEIQEARRAKRLPPSDDQRALTLLDAASPEEVDVHLESLRIGVPEQDVEWPTHAQRLSGAPEAGDAPESVEGVSTAVARDLAAVLEVEERKDVRTDSAGTLRRFRYLLREDPEAAARLAHATSTRVPTSGDTDVLGVPGLSPARRLWAGLLATSLYTWRYAWDGEKPAPVALRQAGARGDFPRAQATLLSMTETPTIEGLRVPLVEAIGLLARTGTPVSWWSLADDLESWSPQIREAWRQAFFTKTSTPTHDTEKEGV